MTGLLAAWRSWRSARLKARARRGQEAAVANVERQLAAGAPKVMVAGEPIRPEAAWAAAQAIRACWRADVAYDGQELVDGCWHALGETTDGQQVRIPLGRFPE